MRVHAFAAMAALVLGVVQFALPKGTAPRAIFGRVIRLARRGKIAAHRRMVIQIYGLAFVVTGA
jgi:uncharacterized membrane protein